MNSAPDDLAYTVVINDEGQFSIWPSYRDPPPGWQACAQVGDKQACLDYIREHWTDMRPRSLRDQVSEDNRRP